MSKLFRSMISFGLVLLAVWFGIRLMQREALMENIQLLHTISDSDNVADQQFKIQVRDSVVAEISDMVKGELSRGKEFLKVYIQKLELKASQRFSEAGHSCLSDEEATEENVQSPGNLPLHQLLDMLQNFLHMGRK